jgi:hypothetical protein
MDYSFYAWLEEIKFSTSCGDLALREKTHVQVYQIRYLEIAIKCVLIVEKQ